MISKGDLTVNNTISQRDAFLTKVYELMAKDKDVIVMTADMGAPALDKIRKDFPGQFVNIGIAEQNAIAVASGLVLEGKKVFVYAIAAFITLRCLELIRVENAIMDIPLTIVGVGVGFGYESAGPTHFLLEDLAVMRSMPNITIHSITDSIMASKIAEISYDFGHTNYVRIDRHTPPDIYNDNHDFTQGFSVLREGDGIYIISTGIMTHQALKIAEKLNKNGINIGVIDLYTLPINVEPFVETVKLANKLVSLEEHFLPGGLGSSVLEVLNDNCVSIPVKRLGLSIKDGYCYRYGGREDVRNHYKLDEGNIEEEIKSFIG